MFANQFKLSLIFSCVFILTIALSGCSEKKTDLIKQPYYAITTEGLQQIKEQEDTITFTSCIDTIQCNNEPKYQYKVLATKQIGNVKLLYVETLRYLSAVWKAPDKYQVLALDYAPQRLGVVREMIFYKSLDESKKKGTYNPDHKFTISYYAPSYLKEISTYKPLSSIDSTAFWNLRKRLVKEAIRNKDMISNTKTGDPYKTDATRELINRALIHEKIIPLINGKELDSTLRKLKKNINL
jgi:hypothetical protein